MNEIPKSEDVAPQDRDSIAVDPLELSSIENLTIPRLEDIKPGVVLLNLWLRYGRKGPEKPLKVIVDLAIPTLIIFGQETRSVYGNPPALTVKAIATGSTRYFDIARSVVPFENEEDERSEGDMWCVLADNSPENKKFITAHEDENSGIPALMGGDTQETILANFLAQLGEEMQAYFEEFLDDPEALMSQINSLDQPPKADSTT